ncbi:MAG: glutathione S-transferase [Micropepsaceae bacterium]
MRCTLYVGNKNYSSWSLRPWLCLRWAKIPFAERELRLDQLGYGRHAIEEVLNVSPNGRVPCLHADGHAIWDSLAIAEWAAEEKPDARLWTVDRQTRAEARSVTAEMHAGFECVRRDLPMNIRRRVAAQNWRDETRAEIARIEAIWGGLRTRNKSAGPWLFGTRTIADAFYAPMATRMRTYGVALSAPAQSYCDAVFADADFKAWEAASLANSWDKSGYPVIDNLYT